MNKLIMAAFLLTTLGALNTQPAFEESKALEKTEQNQAVLEKKDAEVPNPQLPNDRVLEEVGDTVSDDKGELTLKAAKEVRQTLEIGPVNLAIGEVKILHVIPDYSMIDFFHGYTHDDEFDIVKVSMEIRNSSDQDVQFSPLAFLETESGEYFTSKKDIYLEELNGVLEPHSVKKGSMGFILDKGETTGTLSLTTSDAADKQGEILSKGQTLDFDF